MTDSDQANANALDMPARRDLREDDDLPYRVTLWPEESSPAGKVLARAASAALARAIYVAALAENPGRRITLHRGSETVSDSREM